MKKKQVRGRFRMLTVAYSEATLDKSNVYRWYKMFSERRDVSDESTTDKNIDEARKFVLANRRFTVREVAEDRGYIDWLLPFDYYQ